MIINNSVFCMKHLVLSLEEGEVVLTLWRLCSVEGFSRMDVGVIFVSNSFSGTLVELGLR